jgi:hypothetical protein
LDESHYVFIFYIRNPNPCIGLVNLNEKTMFDTLLLKSTPKDRLKLYLDFLKNKKQYSDAEIDVLEASFKQY